MRHPMQDKVRFGMRFYVDVDSDDGIRVYADNVTGCRGPEPVTVQTVAEVGAAVQKMVAHNVENLRRQAQDAIRKAEGATEQANALLGRLS